MIGVARIKVAANIFCDHYRLIFGIKKKPKRYEMYNRMQSMKNQNSQCKTGAPCEGESPCEKNAPRQLCPETMPRNV